MSSRSVASSLSSYASAAGEEESNWCVKKAICLAGGRIEFNMKTLNKLLYFINVVYSVITSNVMLFGAWYFVQADVSAFTLTDKAGATTSCNFLAGTRILPFESQFCNLHLGDLQGGEHWGVIYALLWFWFVYSLVMSFWMGYQLNLVVKGVDTKDNNEFTISFAKNLPTIVVQSVIIAFAHAAAKPAHFKETTIMHMIYGAVALSAFNQLVIVAFMIGTLYGPDPHGVFGTGSKLDL